ncbi:MAG: replication-relaxation family protein [Pseudoruegeria sp.]
MENKSRAGTPHFQRKEVEGDIALTEDDEQIFLDLFRHQLLDAHTIRATLPHRSHDWLGRRLRLLTDGQYLTRPLEQRKLRRPGGGSYPKIYGLGNAAARHIKAKFGLPVRTDRWVTSNNRLQPVHIEHTVEQARFMVQLRSSVQKRPDSHGFEYPDEIFRRLNPKLLKKKSLPRKFTATVDWQNWNQKETTVPDGLCALRYLNEPPEKSSRYLFIEIDRGTETIEPTKRNLAPRTFFVRGNSLLRKFVVYEAGWRERAQESIFGIPTFQVLTVTTDPDRVWKMIDVVQKHLPKSPPIRFLFTDFETLAKHQFDVFTVPLLDASGKERSLQ